MNVGATSPFNSQKGITGQAKDPSSTSIPAALSAISNVAVGNSDSGAEILTELILSEITGSVVSFERSVTTLAEQASKQQNSVQAANFHALLEGISEQIKKINLSTKDSLSPEEKIALKSAVKEIVVNLHQKSLPSNSNESPGKVLALIIKNHFLEALTTIKKDLENQQTEENNSAILIFLDEWIKEETAAFKNSVLEVLNGISFYTPTFMSFISHVVGASINIAGYVNLAGSILSTFNEGLLFYRAQKDIGTLNTHQKAINERKLENLQNVRKKGIEEIKAHYPKEEWEKLRQTALEEIRKNSGNEGIEPSEGAIEASIRTSFETRTGNIKSKLRQLAIKRIEVEKDFIGIQRNKRGATFTLAGIALAVSIVFKVLLATAGSISAIALASTGLGFIGISVAISIAALIYFRIVAPHTFNETIKMTSIKLSLSQMPLVIQEFRLKKKKTELVSLQKFSAIENKQLPLNTVQALQEEIQSLSSKVDHWKSTVKALQEQLDTAKLKDVEHRWKKIENKFDKKEDTLNTVQLTQTKSETTTQKELAKSLIEFWDMNSRQWIDEEIGEILENDLGVFFYSKDKEKVEKELEKGINRFLSNDDKQMLAFVKNNTTKVEFVHEVRAPVKDKNV